MQLRHSVTASQRLVFFLIVCLFLISNYFEDNLRI